MEMPPWLSTTLAVLLALGVILPPLGRLIAIRWPVLGTRLEALGNDLTRGLGPRPEAPTPAQAKARVRRVLQRAEKATDDEKRGGS